jgi:hypothetical protein
MRNDDMERAWFIVISVIIVLVGGFLLFLANTQLHGYWPLIPDFIIAYLIMIISKYVRKKYKK